MSAAELSSDSTVEMDSLLYGAYEDDVFFDMPYPVTPILEPNNNNNSKFSIPNS